MTPRDRTANSTVLLCTLAFTLGTQAVAAAEGWELEVHGGISTSTKPLAGSGSVPGTGSGSAPAVASWYFGDGALALNQSLTFFRLQGQLTGVDSALTSRFFERTSGAIVGVRLDRALTGRFSAEFSLDDSFAPLQATSTGRAAFDAANASFLSAWNALLNGPARGTQAVTSADSFVRRGRQIVATGGLVINFMNGPRLRPFAIVGGGAAVDYGGSPTAQLSGTYVLPLAPAPGTTAATPTFHETDAVTLTSAGNGGAIGMFGIGAKIGGGRWRLRIDARDHLRRNTTTTILTATPAAQTSQPIGIFVLGFSPPLVFSTVSGIPSTLSMPLSTVTTFRGTGVQQEITMTLGLSCRF